MVLKKKKSNYLIILFVLSLFILLFNNHFFFSGDKVSDGNDEKKLYWYIPDGMRADPYLFNIFEWAENGELPNIKKMMDNGAYGFSKPTFPSHTPTNFATLFTGTLPHKHGVADGPMHVEGRPLDKVSVGGFNSAAKKISPIWVTQEKDYDKKVVLLSVPGSTPPELEKGITIRGRWGGWGADFHATNFQEEDEELSLKQGRGKKLFFFGPKLVHYNSAQEVKKTTWDKKITSFSNHKEIELTQYGAKVYATIHDSNDDKKVNYDQISFSFDKKEIIAKLKEGEWSNWIPINLKWKVGKKIIPVKTQFKIKVIKLDDDGFYRIRFFYNNLNEHLTKPSYISKEIVEGIGPMVDFVDNFPPQLIYYQEDKDTFLEEAKMSLDWHRDATSFILDKYDPDIFIGDIYTPNQMLTSRWWMGYIDPDSTRYNDVNEKERKILWGEVKEMYKKLDDIVGEILDKADENTYVVLSSDHGAVPLNDWVRLNNLFAEKGWLKFSIDQETGEPIIDWKNSKAIYLKMAHVYVHPEGLSGSWKRGSGKEYEQLRKEVKETLLNLEDPRTGVKPVVQAHYWEDAGYLDLPEDRVGDIIIANEAGYGWNEEMTSDLEIFSTPLKTGYKQAILANEEPGMWTPFIIMGPGVKKGYNLNDPIDHIDQYPTLMTLLGTKIHKEVEGRILNEIIE